MSILTTLIGFALVATGAAGYYLSSFQSITALIPAFFGIAIFLCGRLARNADNMAKASVLAALIAFLGLVGAGMRLPKSYVAMQSGAPTTAFMFQAIMALLCVLQVYITFRFFSRRKMQRA